MNLNGPLTHLCMAPFFGTKENSAAPYQMPQNVASDQGLHRLLTECYIFKKSWIKWKIPPNNPKTEMVWTKG